MSEREPKSTQSFCERWENLPSQSEEIPGVVMCALSLRHLLVGFRLDGVDEVDELDGVLDEEDYDTRGR